jgi:hypothetical protein
MTPSISDRSLQDDERLPAIGIEIPATTGLRDAAVGGCGMPFRSR